MTQLIFTLRRWLSWFSPFVGDSVDFHPSLVTQWIFTLRRWFNWFSPFVSDAVDFHHSSVMQLIFTLHRWLTRFSPFIGNSIDFHPSAVTKLIFTLQRWLQLIFTLRFSPFGADLEFVFHPSVLTWSSFLLFEINLPPFRWWCGVSSYPLESIFRPSVVNFSYPSESVYDPSSITVELWSKSCSRWPGWECSGGPSPEAWAGAVRYMI
jgi:hypothetical protein